MTYPQLGYRGRCPNEGSMCACTGACLRPPARQWNSWDQIAPSVPPIYPVVPQMPPDYVPDGGQQR